ncbi:MAG: methyltransferase family protein [Opitutales bacterium]
MNLPSKLGLIYLVSEVALQYLRRSGSRARTADAGSLAVLWITIGAGMIGGIVVALTVPRFGFSLPRAATQFIGPVFVGGLVLRWWAIISLGRFFTVDVAIAADHELIVRGPYHLMRHPSYTGLMLAFAALAVTLQNWLSLVCVLVPISLALAYRIYVEEIALEATFGDAYRNYAATTKRLIPGLF